MRKLSNLFEEVLKEFEINGDVDYDMYYRMDEFTSRVLQEFLYENNEDFTDNIPWRLVPFARLKRIWEQHAQLGFVRDEKGLQQIMDIMEANTIKLAVLTTLAGHTSADPSDNYEDAWGGYIRGYINGLNREGREEQYVSRDPDQLEMNWKSSDSQKRNSNRIYQEETVTNPYFDDFLEDADLIDMSDDQIYSKLMHEMQWKFCQYYIEDPKIGQARISDYGLDPLVKLCGEMRSASESNGQIMAIDKMLNVVHQRSDIASWYVQGGSDALFDLSASPSERKERNG